MPLISKYKLVKVYYFFLWVSLSLTDWMEVLKVLNDNFYTSDELEYLVLLGIKQAPVYVYILVLQRYWRKAVGC